MLNSVPAGRRLARRAVVSQAVATLLASLVCLAFGREAALGALVGGAAIAIGGGIVGAFTFSGGVGRAGAIFARLLLGTAAKWTLAIVALYVAIAVFAWPAVAVLAGMALAAVAPLLSASAVLGRA